MNSAQNRSFGVAPYEALQAMSGLEFLVAIRDGALPQAPICGVLGLWLSEVETGRAVFEGVPSIDAYNPIGSVHGGWYGTLLDSCMGCAVQSSLEQGTGYTTVEYSVNLVRAITVDTGRVRAEGRLMHRGRRMATAEGRLVAADGKLLAHGTTTCMIIDLPAP
jgi:uncharacterized protein (TIGR00369 family)